MTREEEGAAFGPHTRTPAELIALEKAKRRGGAFLLLRDGDGAQRIFMLGDRDRVRIGRGRARDLSLHWDDEVSSVHVELTRIDEEWLIEDLSSKNGTFVKGIKLKKQRLADGDVLVVGVTSIQFNTPTPRVPPTKPSTGPVFPTKQLTPAQERVLRSLCRPYCSDREHALPATNQEIADALTMSPDGVKRHLRALFGLYGVAHLPQNHKRLKLAQAAIEAGWDPCAS